VEVIVGPVDETQINQLIIEYQNTTSESKKADIMSKLYDIFLPMFELYASVAAKDNNIDPLVAQNILRQVPSLSYILEVTYLEKNDLIEEFFLFFIEILDKEDFNNTNQYRTLISTFLNSLEDFSVDLIKRHNRTADESLEKLIEMELSELEEELL